jgi:hypothetical protein
MSVAVPEKEISTSPLSSRSRGVTWRSVLLGTIAVLAVCTLTPINDYAWSNTSLTSGFLPLAAVLVLFVVVVAINAPLHRWFPNRALSTSELAVIVLMSFMGCSLSNWGLARFFIPTPVTPFHLGSADDTFWRAFTGMNLPKQLFPVKDIASGRTDDAVTWFYRRVPEGQKIPWGAWVMPLLTWGVFIAAMLATLAAMARLTFEQWATNERLPFPLVQVQSALLEPPSPGKFLNEIFRSRVFWIGLLGVMAVHTLSCLNTYFPKNFPKIPLGYDLSSVFSEPPLFYLYPKVKKATLSFTVIGVTYFIRSRVAFSLWVTFIAMNLVDMQYSMRQGEMPSAAWQDQHLGACVAFIGGFLWIGRHHWIKVIKDAFFISRERVHTAPFWIAVVGSIVMVAWLRAVGVQVWVGTLIVVFILMAQLVVARVVAETGLPFYRSSVAVSQINSNLPVKMFGMRDVFFSCVFTILGPLTTRDGLTTFTQQGLGLSKAAGKTRGLGWVIVWALLIGFFSASLTTLWCQYSYPTPIAADQVPTRNYFGAEYLPKRELGNPFDDFARGRFTPKQYDPALHLGIGFGLTVFLEVAALRWASWPLLPVGYVAGYGAFVGNAWLSIFVGWIAQLLVVRLGGASLFQKARPFFIGIIFGEGLAAGIWLIINAIIVMNGGESQAVKFLL